MSVHHACVWCLYTHWTSLKSESQVVFSYHVGLGIGVALRHLQEDLVLLTTEQSDQPSHLQFFLFFIYLRQIFLCIPRLAESSNPRDGSVCKNAMLLLQRTGVLTLEMVPCVRTPCCSCRGQGFESQYPFNVNRSHSRRISCHPCMHKYRCTQHTTGNKPSCQTLLAVCCCSPDTGLELAHIIPSTLQVFSLFPTIFLLPYLYIKVRFEGRNIKST